MVNGGVITEQGDLGLGFDLFNQQDNKVFNESINKNNKDNREVVNEDKKN